jgi:DNA-binding CsgD family transcriptional regulator
LLQGELSEELPTNEAKIALERWFREGLLCGDVERGAEVFMPDLVMHCASGGIGDLAALKLAAREFVALDALQGELAADVAGDQLVARYVLRGRQSRPLLGTYPTGELIELRGIVTIRAVGDRLAELWHTSVARHRSTGGETQVIERKPWACRWGLTPREASIAELAMRGESDKQIAAEFGLATTSVSKYLRRILRKAGVASRTALAECAGVVRLG